MTGVIQFEIPFWFFEDIANSLAVKSQLKKITEYRKKVTIRKFVRSAQPLNDALT